MKRTLTAALAGLALFSGGVADAEPSTTPALSGDQTADRPGWGDVSANSGQATAQVPLAFPPGRRNAVPRLGLSYSHGGGPSEVGEGWSLGLPVIERRGVAGSSVPSFVDVDTGGDDHFYYSGDRLIKVGTVSSNKVGNDPMPIWANGWTLYRPMVEHGSTRVFWSSDHLTWRVQLPDGGLLEFGNSLIVPGCGPATDVDRGDSSKIVRWKLVLDSDSDVVTNPVVYVWQRVPTDAPARLTDVYYTHSAAAGPSALTSYAHHVRLEYTQEQLPGLWNLPAPAGLRALPAMHVSRITVASKQGTTASARERVRSYRFSYVKMRGGRPFLRTAALVGRCGAPHYEQPDANPSPDLRAGPVLPDDRDCPQRPPYQFTYSRDYGYQPYVSGGVLQGVRTLPDGTSVAGPLDDPAHDQILGDVEGAFSEPLAFTNMSVADVNHDGFPDFISTFPQRLVYLSKGPAFTTTGVMEYGLAGLGNADGPPALNLAATYPNQEPIFNSTTSNALTTGGQWSDPRFTEFLSRATSAPTGAFPQRLLRVDSVMSDAVQLREVRSDYPVPTGAPHAFGDLDGDGTIDALYLATPTGPVKAAFSRRSVTGIAGLSQSVDSNLQFGFAEPNVVPVPSFQIADMNGDGFADYVTVWRSPASTDPYRQPTNIFYYPGRGDGNFGCMTNASPCEAFGGAFHLYSSTTYGVRLYFPADDSTIPLNCDFHDVTGDGRADYVCVSSDSQNYRIDVWQNLDGQSFAAKKSWISPLSSGIGRVSYADINGSGVDDIVLLNATGGNAFDFQQDGKPGLLTSVVSPDGATTEFEYDTVQREAARGDIDWQADPAHPDDRMTGPWKNRSPVPSYIVKKVTHRSNAPGPYARSASTTYSYRDAVFDSWRNELRGFRRTREVRGTEVVETRYMFGGCLTEDGVTPAANGPVEERCATRDTDPFDALNGKPFQTDRYAVSLGSEFVEGMGTWLSTGFTTYTVRRIGTDRWLAYASEFDTLLYDTSNFAPSSSTLKLPPSKFTSDGVTTQNPWDIAVHATMCGTSSDTTGCTVRLRSRVDMDDDGAVLTEYEDGRVAFDGSPVDRPILTTRTYTRINDSAILRIYMQDRRHDGFGLVTPIGPEPPPRTTYFGYDIRGRLTSVSAIPNGTVFLARSHETGAATAPEPTTSLKPSTTAPFAFQTLTYDAGTGNLTRISGASGECADLTYDASFADAVTSTTSYVNGCGSSVNVVQSVWYDRGLGVVQGATGSGAVSTFNSYDVFGRVVAVARAPIGQFQDAAHTVLTVERTDPDANGISSARVTELDPEQGTSHVSWSFFDSFGAAVATFSTADPGVGDWGDWVAVPGPVRREVDGQPLYTFTPFFWSGDPTQFSIAAGPTAAPPGKAAEYDAHGRLFRVRNSTNMRLLSEVDHGALSVKTWNAEALDVNSPHYGHYVRIQQDGHGNTTQQISFDDFGYEERSDYDHSFAGDVTGIRRSSAANGTEYVRWMRFDAFGRMVENAEPNTATGFAADPSSATSLKAWRYAYDRSGRLVGTRDARGCGKNLSYDGLGRLVSEDYSPCKAFHAAYSAAAEAVWTWDAPESGQTTDYGAGTAYLTGRLAAYRDRSTWNRYGYDELGRQTGLARRVSGPQGQVLPITSSTGYAATWYRKQYQFDGFGRPTLESSGATAPELVGIGGASTISFAYSARGVVKSIGSSYGDLVPVMIYDALGRPTLERYGDTAETTTATTYDPVEQRVATIQTTRGAPYIWTTPSGSYAPSPDGVGIESVLRDEVFSYDGLGNIVSITDQRDPSLWPDGAKPASRTYSYDASFRVKSVDLAHGNDIQVSPFQKEEQVSDPSPFPRTVTGSRAVHQMMAHDHLGNLYALVGDVDDVLEHGFGAATMSATRPHQIEQTSSTAGVHQMTPHYDEAGNVIGLDVDRTAICSAPTGKCTQRFLFEWDEVGQLTRARRWDLASLQDDVAFPAVPTSPVSAEARYRYSSGQRVMKEVIENGASTFTIDIFDSLRVTSATWSSTTADYVTDATHTSVNLGGVARVISRPGLPSITGDQHTLLLLRDQLGSTSTVLDKGTSEITEMITYLPHGGVETDFRPSRWDGLREDKRFVNKDEDVEFGVVAMGVRPYSPLLGRFMSPDPLTVHGVSGDLNPYGYVGGNVANLTDPTGLDWCWPIACETASPPPSQGEPQRTVSGDGANPTGPSSSRSSSTAGGRSGGGGAPPPPPAPKPAPTFDPRQIVSGVRDFATKQVGASGDAVKSALYWAEDQGILKHAQAVTMGPLHAIPAIGPPGVGPSIANVLKAIGIKTDKSAEKTELVASVVAPLAMGGVAGIVETASSAAARVAAPAAEAAAGVAESNLVGKVQATVAKGGTYLLRDAESGAVMRTGRTVDLARRAGEHARDPALKDLVFEVVHRTDNYAQQRGLEQYLHNLFSPPLNKIRPISPLNPNGPRYMKAAEDFLKAR